MKKINKEKPIKDEYESVYIPDKNKTRIFGSEFIKNNKDKFRIIYDNIIYNPEEYFEDIIKIYNNKDLIKLKIIGIDNIFNFSSMFAGCSSLKAFSPIKYLNNLEDIIDKNDNINIKIQQLLNHYLQYQLIMKIL